MSASAVLARLVQTHSLFPLFPLFTVGLLSVLDTHSFKKMEFQPAEARKFFSTVRKEMALLATSLPDGIMVKTFEDRMVGVLLTPESRDLQESSVRAVF